MSFYDVHPARPAGEMEWEDVLVRYEIAPRALRVAKRADLDRDRSVVVRRHRVSANRRRTAPAIDARGG